VQPSPVHVEAGGKFHLKFNVTCNHKVSGCNLLFVNRLGEEQLLQAHRAPSPTHMC
jgi:hypothetical protein